MMLRKRKALTENDAVASELALLSTIEPSEAAFVSCYLDTRVGKSACLQFVNDQARSVSAQLEGRALLDFQSAATMVARQVERNWRADSQGMALFARSITGGRYLSVLHTAAPLRDSMTVYRVPQILPLLELQYTAPAFTLLQAREGTVQVLDVDAQQARPRAMAVGLRSQQRLRGAVREALHPTNGSSLAWLKRPLQRLRPILARSVSPMVLAGDADTLDAVSSALPRRIAAHLADTVSIPRRLDERAGIDHVRQHVMQTRRMLAKQLAARLVQATSARGAAATGPFAAQQALQEGSAGTLVVAADASTHAVFWDARIELSRLAQQQGVPVVVADSDELRHLGGIGCLLTQRTETRAEPQPVRYGTLDLVA
jgi:ribosomal protein L7Ae-like RNA K-turn-binding protein